MPSLIDFSGLSLTWIIIIFVLSTVVIGVAGSYLTKYADVIADITKLGEALIGAVLLGAATSLAGVITSLSAAIQHHPELAISNAIGGIAVQTFFLTLADLSYRKANLEHATASMENVMNSVLLIGLLGILLFIRLTPEVTFLGFNPGSPIIILTYVAGLWLVRKATKTPMWKPTSTEETVGDEPMYRRSEVNRTKLWLFFSISALFIIVAGHLVAEAGIAISERTVLSETFVGGFFTAVSSSLPELIVSVMAVRQGSVTMAVGNIVGGNAFEVIVVALADFFYPGSILHAASSTDAYIIVLTLLLMVVLLMGLLYREERGIAKIGWESLLIAILFIVGYVILYFLR